jgi:hypothetical protein
MKRKNEPGGTPAGSTTQQGDAVQGTIDHASSHNRSGGRLSNGSGDSGGSAGREAGKRAADKGVGQNSLPIQEEALDAEADALSEAAEVVYVADVEGDAKVEPAGGRGRRPA